MTATDADTLAATSRDEQVAQLAKLREPFPPETIGKLPRITCQACSKRQCQKHAKARCAECGNWITTEHIHLDYVGHAATTDRLRQVDPFWTWEPLAYDERGLPRIADGQLWIKLTVCGVTRLGVGDGKSDKERIGDAIRNAAMRFGVALDLWSKEDLDADPVNDRPSGSPEPAPSPPAGPSPKMALVEALEGDVDRASEVWGATPPDARPTTVAGWRAHLASTVAADATFGDAENLPL